MFLLLTSVTIPILVAQSVGIPDIASLGAAGIIGAMWLYERKASTKREAQIDEAHARIIADRVMLDALLGVVRDNSRVLAQLTETLEGTPGCNYRH